MTTLALPRDVRRRRKIDACSFCGRREAQAGRLLADRSALICGSCVREAAALLVVPTS